MHDTIQSQLLAGAEACRLMLAGIEGLPTIKREPDLAFRSDDDGERRDYASADAAVAEALDCHGGNPGFRQALSNYLLMVSEAGSVRHWDAAEMLTDCGYRGSGPPVASEPSDEAAAAGSEIERQDVAVEATYEIEGIANVLRGLEETWQNWRVMQGLLLRVLALNSVAMSVLGGDDIRELADMRSVVFGPRGRAKASPPVG